MLTHEEVQSYLRRFEPLREVMVEPKSEILMAPHLEVAWGGDDLWRTPCV